MAIENINDITEYLNTNAESEEVKGLIKSFQQPLNRDTVEAWCKDGEGKSWLDRNCDLYSNKAVETARNNAIAKFKEEELPKLQEEYYKAKTGEGMTEEQKQMKALQDEIEKMKSEKAETERIKANADKLKEKGLNTDLARFINSDEDIQFFETLIANSVDSKVKEKLGDGAYVPPTGGSSDAITQEKFNKMSYNEKLELYKNNKALYEQFTK